MLATARFDHGHQRASTGCHLHIALQDDVVGHERDGVGAESQLRVIIVVFDRFIMIEMLAPVSVPSSRTKDSGNPLRTTELGQCSSPVSESITTRFA